MRKLLATLAVVTLAGWAAIPPDPALCSTDTECSAHCPPPADDPDCDGGPEWLPLPILYRA